MKESSGQERGDVALTQLPQIQAGIEFLTRIKNRLDKDVTQQKNYVQSLYRLVKKAEQEEDHTKPGIEGVPLDPQKREQFFSDTLRTENGGARFLRLTRESDENDDEEYANAIEVLLDLEKKKQKVARAIANIHEGNATSFFIQFWEYTKASEARLAVHKKLNGNERLPDEEEYDSKSLENILRTLAPYVRKKDVVTEATLSYFTDHLKHTAEMRLEAASDKTMIRFLDYARYFIGKNDFMTEAEKKEARSTYEEATKYMKLIQTYIKEVAQGSFANAKYSLEVDCKHMTEMFQSDRWKQGMSTLKENQFFYVYGLYQDLLKAQDIIKWINEIEAQKDDGQK